MTEFYPGAVAVTAINKHQLKKNGKKKQKKSKNEKNNHYAWDTYYN